MKITGSSVRLVTVLTCLHNACGSATEPSKRRLAYVDSRHNGRIDVPDTVRANAPVQVTVYAVESSSIECNTPSGTNVSQINNLVRVEVFVRSMSNGNQTCKADIKLYPFTLSVTFPTVGSATIRAIGRGPSDVLFAASDSVSRNVIVVP